MDEQLRILYQKFILEHNKNPYHYEKQADAAIVLEAYNPMCGDQFKLYLTIEADRVVTAHFHGYGCAISKASTSILIKRIEGKSLAEVQQLIQDYMAMLHNDQAAPDEELQAFAAAKAFPGRMDCATLSWQELKTYLE